MKIFPHQQELLDFFSRDDIQSIRLTPPEVAARRSRALFCDKMKELYPGKVLVYASPAAPSGPRGRI